MRIEKESDVFMALNHIRHEKAGGRQYGMGNRTEFFMRIFYSGTDVEKAERKTPEEIFQFLSGYHLYLEHEYGLATGSMYSLKISDHPLEPRGCFKCEYVHDFGSIMEFLNDYYGFTRERKSDFGIWKKYRKFKKVEYYTPADLGEKLIQLSRELYFRYQTQEYIDDQHCDIIAYDIDFEFNHVDAWLRFTNLSGGHPDYMTTATVIST